MQNGKIQWFLPLNKGEPQLKLCWFGIRKVVHLCFAKHFLDLSRICLSVCGNLCFDVKIFSEFAMGLSSSSLNLAHLLGNIFMQNGFELINSNSHFIQNDWMNGVPTTVSKIDVCPYLWTCLLFVHVFTHLDKLCLWYHFSFYSKVSTVISYGNSKWGCIEYHSLVKLILQMVPNPFMFQVLLLVSQTFLWEKKICHTVASPLYFV